MTKPENGRAVAAVGDVTDIDCWSGIPFYFWQAASRSGLTELPWQLQMEEFKWPRRFWNCAQLLKGRGRGGYQYSLAFLEAAERQIGQEKMEREVITFHQQFPRARTVARNGGRLIHYIDGTFASCCGTGGLAAKLPRRVQEEAAALERENYAQARYVVTMARWAAKSVVRDCGVPEEKVKTILPGANFDLPDGHTFRNRTGRPGKDRPVVLGFVGKDWRRKGLPFLLEVRSTLERMGFSAVVRVAGYRPGQFAREAGLDYVGFIDKARETSRFLDFLEGCDLGCLFSEHEPLGISTLEFLRAGVPVAGFEIEGLADTLPPDAGLRFGRDSSPEMVADVLRMALTDESAMSRLKTAAQRWSPLMTWQRCTAEWSELLETGTVANPVRPWQGGSEVAHK